MNAIGNLLWIIFGGFISFLSWMFFGILWCVSIVGIPVGIQCFKLATFSLFPFGKEIVYDDVGISSGIANLLWLIFGGLEIAFVSFVTGLILCVTVVGIPFGLQHFKIAKLALLPFGSRIE